MAIQARLALSGAAERAAALGAHRQAVAYLRQALEVTADPVERGPLLERAALSASDAAELDSGKVLAREAIEQYRAIGDLTSAARATAELGAIMLNAQEAGEAREVLEEALAALPDSAPDEVRARLLTNLSRALMRANRFTEAVEAADRALPLAERLKLQVVIADAFNNKASALGNLGRSREATALMEAAVAIAAASGDLSVELRARSNLASTIWSSDPARALAMQVVNYDLACRVGNRQMANWIISAKVAGIWLTAGDWDAVLAEGEEALGTATDIAEAASIGSSNSLIRNSRGESTDEDLARLREAAANRSDELPRSLLHGIQGDRAMLSGQFREAFVELMAAAEFQGLSAIFLAEAHRPAFLMRDLAAAREVATRLDDLPSALTPR